MKLVYAVIATLTAALVSAGTALAFCGFYVAKADSKLFNRASRVVLARHEDRTVITMANDYRGDLKAFAIVIPVPTVLERGQIHVGDRAPIEHLDAYTAPRLVEYFDEDPCRPRVMTAPAAQAGAAGKEARRDAVLDKTLGVTIEAQYIVGEYDILILSAKESTGLETWLRGEGYRVPAGAAAVLGSYIKQNTKFFLARVNLKEQSALGFTYLRPLQIAFESPKFMLPIRLGMVNADGPQELFVYALSRKGRVETTNYRTVRLPTGVDLPVYVKGEFSAFYRAMFAEQVRREDMRAVFLEYAWDMSWSDPCAADPLTNEELRQLGVFWLDDASPGPGSVPPGRRPQTGGGTDVFATRLHVRYDADHFPEDLVFQETADRANFQGRYVLRHPFGGAPSCEAARRYQADLRVRAEREVVMLASLTGWPIEAIRKKMVPPYGDALPDAHPWWQRLWSD